MESIRIDWDQKRTGIESVFDSYYLINLSVIDYRSSWQLKVRTLID